MPLSPASSSRHRDAVGGRARARAAVALEVHAEQPEVAELLGQLARGQLARRRTRPRCSGSTRSPTQRRTVSRSIRSSSPSRWSRPRTSEGSSFAAGCGRGHAPTVACARGRRDDRGAHAGRARGARRVRRARAAATSSPPRRSTPRGAAFHHARHEGGAISMADGYARVSGRVGVCSVHQGPGFTNALTGLTEAAKSRTPLLVLAARRRARRSARTSRSTSRASPRSLGAVPERIHSGATRRRRHRPGAAPRPRRAAARGAQHAARRPGRAGARRRRPRAAARARAARARARGRRGGGRTIAAAERPAHRRGPRRGRSRARASRSSASATRSAPCSRPRRWVTDSSRARRGRSGSRAASPRRVAARLIAQADLVLGLRRLA